MNEVFKHAAAAAVQALPAFPALGGDVVAFSFSVCCTSLRSAQATRELRFPLKPISSWSRGAFGDEHLFIMSTHTLPGEHIGVTEPRRNTSPSLAG